MEHVQNKNAGFALIITLIVVSVALSIGLSMLDITVKQLTLGTTTRESEVAFQAAAAGMNCLQYARSAYSSQTQLGGNFTMDCLGHTISMNSSGSSFIHLFTSDFDWGITGSNALWIHLEMQVVDATAAQRTYTDLLGVPNRTCTAGSICTMAISRGHNRDQSTISAGSIFSVERQLTAEF